MDFDTKVKLTIYEMIARTTMMPTSADVSNELGASVEKVASSFKRLYARRLLVLEPGGSSEIIMAPPFSGVETSFLVTVGNKSYYANCVWDAFGVAAALHRDTVIRASDGFTGAPITLEVRGGKPVHQDCVAHFAVPAAKWWDDIIYT